MNPMVKAKKLNHPLSQGEDKIIGEWKVIFQVNLVFFNTIIT